jgi:hypothetical protein
MARPALLLLPILLATTTTARGEGEPHQHPHSPFEVRASVEAPIFSHASAGSTNITHELEPELDVMASYLVIPKQLSIDLEVGEAVLVSSKEEPDAPIRKGTTIRPGVGFTPDHAIPIYVLAMLPIHVEPAPVVLGFRVGVGFDVHLPFGKYFAEAALDLPLVGGAGAPDAFATQTFVLATGLLFHL